MDLQWEQIANMYSKRELLANFHIFALLFLGFPYSCFTGARFGRIPWRRARDFPSLTHGQSRIPPDNSLLFTSDSTVSDRS